MLRVYTVIAASFLIMAIPLGYNGWFEMEHTAFIATKMVIALAAVFGGFCVGLAGVLASPATEVTRNFLLFMFVAYVALAASAMCYSASNVASWVRYGAPILLWLIAFDVMRMYVHSEDAGNNTARA